MLHRLISCQTIPFILFHKNIFCWKYIKNYLNYLIPFHPVYVPMNKKPFPKIFVRKFSDHLPGEPYSCSLKGNSENSIPLLQAPSQKPFPKKKEGKENPKLNMEIEAVKTFKTSLDPENVNDLKAFHRQKYIKLRWVISMCDCFMQISKFFCMDSAQALQKYFQSGNLNLSGTEYNMFYSIFAYLFILPFLSGLISDRIGIRWGLFLFCLIQTFGHIIFMFGGAMELYWLMLIGRFVFGWGALCVEVCEDVVISIWFFDKELTMALGLSFASCRIGTALTSVITPKVMKLGGENYFYPLLVGTFFCLAGLVACLVIIYLDKKYQPFIKENGVDEYIQDVSLSHQEKKLTIQELRKFSSIFWVLALNCIFAYTSYFAFVDNGNDLLCTLFGYTPQSAGDLLTIVYMVSAFLTPIFGIIIDKTGRRLNLMLFAIIFLIAPHVLLNTLPADCHKIWVSLSLFLIGVFFAIFAAVFWSCVPLVVEEQKQGIGFGIVYSSLNIVLVIASLFIGIIHDTTLSYKGGYEWSVNFMIISLVFAVVTVFILRHLDDKKGAPLNSKTTNTEIRKTLNEDSPDIYMLQGVEEMESEIK